MESLVIALVVILLPTAILLMIKLYIILSVKWNRSHTCLVGKTAIVTGSNIGIGYYTALDFAKRGARVILACRNPAKAEEAKLKIIETTGNKNVIVKIVDLSSLKSVRDFAKDVNETEDRLNILINNAGGGCFRKPLTEDGLNRSMQTNHFGPFLLTVLLTDLLKKSAPSRIVTVSSILAAYGRLNLDDLNASPRFFAHVIDYCKAKLCLMLFTIELAQKLQGTGVTVNVVHPGVFKSDYLKDTPTIFTKILYVGMKLLFSNTEAGCQTPTYVAVAKELSDVTGKYFKDCAESEFPRAARNRILAKKLWEKTEDIVKLSPEERPSFNTHRILHCLDFAKRGARVILACRNPLKAEEAKLKIIEATGNEKIVVKILDLASFKSVREFANDIIGTEERLDILVNNAGAAVFNQPITEDGLNSSMQTNHFGPFLLTILLTNLLKKSAPSRIVTVSSFFAAYGTLDLDNLNKSPKFLPPVFDYCKVKLCNMLFTIELAQKLHGSGVTANVVHPGTIKSDIIKDNSSLIGRIFAIYMKLFFLNTETGCQTPTYVAVAKEVSGVSGKYFKDCAESDFPRSARNKTLAKKLWNKSEDFVKLTTEERLHFIA
ncbi:hypothetical protein FQR65_LT06698 [Abscondita terminalis]|nr:hypothetical protein FQR65_LT06698 [Abscondita terminalis]